MLPIVFTKFFKGMTREEVAARALELGFAGLDFALREGQCVTPETVGELPAVVEYWRRQGLVTPMVSLETSWVEADRPGMEEAFAACAEAEVPFIKLGYWTFDPALDYWQAVDAIEEALKHFEALARRYGVTALVHTHSGNVFGCNASAVMDLVGGCDPDHVAVYLDPAHLAVEGESLPMALRIVEGYLRVVALKNVEYVAGQEGNLTLWKRRWCKASEGLVNWPEALRRLSEFGFDGPVSIHGEYSGPKDQAEVQRWLEQDMAFIRPLFLG